MKAWFDKWLIRSPKRQQVNQPADDQPTSFFAHIPKTAGTSFIVLLDRFYHAARIYPAQLWREVGSIDKSDNQKYDLYRGHFGGHGVEVLTDRPLRCFTILRDPVAMAQSTFQYVQRENNTKVHELVTANEMSFADFLRHPETVSLVKNRMIRYLSFDFKQDPAAQEVFLSSETITYLQTIINQNQPSIDDEKRLKRAQAWVERCQWFGLLERFDQSMQLLCFAMKWPPIGPSQKLNTRRHKPVLLEEELQLLQAINQQDMAFYAWASEVFEQKLTAMQDQLEVHRTGPEQGIDELLDLRYQQHYSRHRKSALPVGVRYGFAQTLLGSQWHRRELLSPEKDFFRWSGPGNESTIDLWLQPMNYQIQVRIINATTIELLDQLQVSLNDHPLSWRTMDTGVVRVLNMSCSADMIAEHGLARLKFHCADMISHRQAFGSQDERLVGIAVHWIEFKHEA